MFPQNLELQTLIQTQYSIQELERLRRLLFERGALSFPVLPSRLFPAALVRQVDEHTGYGAVWVRDNVHIAHSLMMNGEAAKSAGSVLALADHFERESKRLDAIIADPSSACDPGNRPHVKFHGYPIDEIPNWSHDQNDALGYFVWIFARMVRLGHVVMNDSHGTVMGRLTRYFEAIRFWRDEDSGHWEEARKNSASSVGVVCAGLRELMTLLGSEQATRLRRFVSMDLLESLLKAGLERMTEILPAECIQEAPKCRRYDAALLFLAYPLEIVTDQMAQRIIQDVQANLQGEHGIRRYIGDSFWSANYRRNVSPENRTRDYSSDMASRERLFEHGTEAQWCLFDPIISVWYGRRYQSCDDTQYLERQTAYFNRCLSQITRDFRCPELWHWETSADGFPVWETSDATPLLWTQANLWLALSHMEQSARRESTL
jgi:phosphorylase kinase alpha/beta subunit